MSKTASKYLIEAFEKTAVASLGGSTIVTLAETLRRGGALRLRRHCPTEYDRRKDWKTINYRCLQKMGSYRPNRTGLNKIVGSTFATLRSFMRSNARVHNWRSLQLLCTSLGPRE